MRRKRRLLCERTPRVRSKCDRKYPQDEAPAYVVNSLTKDAGISTARIHPFQRDYIMNVNAHDPAARVVSFLFEFTRMPHPPVSLYLTFKMSSPLPPRFRSAHIATRKRHRMSLLGLSSKSGHGRARDLLRFWSWSRLEFLGVRSLSCRLLTPNPLVSRSFQTWGSDICGESGMFVQVR